LLPARATHQTALDMSAARETWIVLAIAYVIVAFVCALQVHRIARRVPNSGVTTQKAFFAANSLAFVARAFAFALYAAVDTSTWPLVRRVVAFDAPTLLYASAYGTVSLFWGEILRGARGVSARGARRVHHGVGGVIWSVEIAIWIALGVGRGRDADALAMASRATLATACLLVALDFAARGARLFSMLRAFPTDLGATRRRKMREVGIVAATCVAMFTSRAGVLISRVNFIDAVAVCPTPQLNVAYYVGLELSPAVVVLFVLRKLPPKRRASDDNDESNGLRDPLVTDDESDSASSASSESDASDSEP